MEPRLPDHAHCTVDSYTHGLISLEDAAAAAGRTYADADIRENFTVA